MVSPAVTGGAGNAKFSVVPSSDIAKVQEPYIVAQPVSPIEVSIGISAAEVSDVQSSYIFEHPLSPIEVSIGISAAEVNDVQP